jgi:hypothetical protein
MVMETYSLFQEGYPIRPKSMNHIHMNPAITSVFNMFKTFMNEKMRSRVSQQYHGFRGASTAAFISTFTL